jgi:hypothetical protein
VSYFDFVSLKRTIAFFALMFWWLFSKVKFVASKPPPSMFIPAPKFLKSQFSNSKPELIARIAVTPERFIGAFSTCVCGAGGLLAPPRPMEKDSVSSRFILESHRPQITVTSRSADRRRLVSVCPSGHLYV